MPEFKISKKRLTAIFNNAVGKTLGELDSQNIFHRTVEHPKITGIAGDVIEQSVIGYPPDSKQEPDLLVDGIPIELKTTGIRKSKKKNDNRFEAKEPMTITAVSPKRIIHEEFETSKFWHKLEHMLIVYYHYDSEITVPAAKYADFPLKGYHFHEFSTEDREILKNDWLIVRDYLAELEKSENPEASYPLLSSQLRKDLMLIDTSPKWPNLPRFRLKRTAVTTIVQSHFGRKFEELNESYTTFKELDSKLQELTMIHHGKTVKQLMKEFGMPIRLNGMGDVNKGITEQIVIKMFEGTSSKMKQIELFSKVGLLPKTVTQTEKGARTEDFKLLAIDFEEWIDEEVTFEESSVYSYFNDQQFLCILFEAKHKGKLLDNCFLGFKRLVIPDYIVNKDVRMTWERVRELVNSGELKESQVYKANGELKMTPKTKLPETTLNFPKSKNNLFFLRGSGLDASKKTLTLNGIKMYQQNLWMKGEVLLDMLRDIEYI